MQYIAAAGKRFGFAKVNISTEALQIIRISHLTTAGQHYRCQGH